MSAVNMLDRFRRTRIAIVVPCFNESERLEVQTFIEFANRFPQITFVMVDDGSQDGTFELFQQMSKAHPDQFVLHRLNHNQGKAEAVRQGLLLALKLDCEFAGFWDADLATPLEEIENFSSVLNRTESLQAVIGCRLPLLGRQIDRNPQRARLGRAFSIAASKILGGPFRDTQCGAKLFRITPELAASLVQPFCSSWIFDVELLARLRIMYSPAQEFDRWVYELPLNQWSEKAGSKLRIKHFFKAAFELISIYRNYRGSAGAKIRAQQFNSMLEKQVELLEFPVSNGASSTVPETVSRAA